MKELLEAMRETMREVIEEQKVIRESQIRTEADLKFHIKRTNLLEEKLNAELQLLNAKSEKLRQDIDIVKKAETVLKFMAVIGTSMATLGGILYTIREFF